MQNERQIRESAEMRKLSKLILLVSKIKSEEIPLIRHYLSAGQKLNKKTQLLNFFDFLLNNQKAIPSEIYKAYPELSPRTIDNLATKISQKLLSALVDENTYRIEGLRNEKQIAVFSVKDIYKQVLVLTERGMPILALDKVTELIELGREFELYEDLVSALYVKQSLIKVESKPDELFELEAEINFYSQANSAVRKAAYTYEHLSSLLANTAERNKNYIIIENGIEELRNLYGQTSSSFVLYYLISLEIIYYIEVGKYKISYKKAQELLELVQNKPALTGKHQLPVCYMYLATTLIGLYQFNDALVYCELAKSQLTTGSWNYGETLLLEYYAHFYLNDFDKAFASICKLTDTNEYPATLFKRNERNYLKTCCLIAMGEYVKAEQELGQIYQITKDKAGWNIGIRILSVLLNFVNDKPENMLRNYENLQCELRRIKSLSRISERDKQIIIILRELISSQGNIKYVYKKCAKTIELLEMKNTTTSWRIFGHEVLPFDQWLKCKIKRSKFTIELVFVDEDTSVLLS